MPRPLPEPSAFPVARALCRQIADEPPAEAPKKGAKKKGGQLVPAPIDPEVIRIQAAGDANAPAPAAGRCRVIAARNRRRRDSARTCSTDRRKGRAVLFRPTGCRWASKRSMLSVEVQSPANLNFKQPATVKIIVRNSGSTDAAGRRGPRRAARGPDLREQPARGPAGGRLAPELADQHAAGGLRSGHPAEGQADQGRRRFDHAATVTFQAGSKATSRVLRPRLKVEVVQTPTDGKVLKNKTAEFRIAVTNTRRRPRAQRDRPGQAQPRPAGTRPASGTRTTASSCRSSRSAPASARSSTR